jgi:hypothetical protein
MRLERRHLLAPVIRVGKPAMQQDDRLALAEDGVPDLDAVNRGRPLWEVAGSVGVGGKVSHCGSLCAAELIKKVTKNTSWSTQICTWFRVKQLALSRRGSSMVMTPATSVSQDMEP